MSFLDLFTHPIYRAPMWGTLFMCVASSLIGVVLFLRKKTLLSETLSHAAFPGIVFFLLFFERASFFIAAIGAFISSFFAEKLTHFLQDKRKVNPDSALCFTLSLFFGAGVFLLSILQAVSPSKTTTAQSLLFGQAATMTDIHIVFYGSLALVSIAFFYLGFYQIQSAVFDFSFSKSIGISVGKIDRLFNILFLLSLILGIRSVGVVLMSAMLIAPAVTARQFTNRLHRLLILSSFFAAMSGVLGNWIAMEKSLPTGPIIVLVATFFAFFSLLFAPKRGLVFQKMRIFLFHLRCGKENALKTIWKKGALSPKELKEYIPLNAFLIYGLLFSLKREGFLEKKDHQYRLTQDGSQKASHIVRLHRLWELYLSDVLNMHIEKVHGPAEEMEHILTPDLERRLTRLLKNPTLDPHLQPIPEKGEALE